MKLPKELREKSELIGAGSKQRKCSVNGCNEIAIRSLSENKWKKFTDKTGLKIKENKQHRIFLCKAHYKQVNKVRKHEEKLYMKKGFLDDSRLSKKGKYLD
ncbi:MAG: hypothetical protein ACTSVV_04430 [Promethearchaeota archaeon]